MLRKTFISILLLGLAAVSGAHAASMVFASKRPELSLAINPQNHQAANRLAELSYAAEVAKDQTALVTDIPQAIMAPAMEAYEGAPLSLAALKFSALQLAHQGDQGSAVAMMERAAGLSKRDGLANLWLVGYYANNGQTDLALSSIDVSLRGNRTAYSVVLPLLVGLLENEDSLPAISRLLDRKPPWEQGFWRRASQTRVALQNASKLRLARYTKSGIPDSDIDSKLIKSLANAGHRAAAHSHYSVIAPKRRAKDGAVVIDPGSFSFAPEYAPIEWETVSTGDLAAFVAPESNELVISALPNSSGVVARRLFKIDEDSLQLKARMNTDTAAGVSVELRARCAESGNLITSLTLALRQINQSPRANVNGCEIGSLEIYARVSGDGAPSDISITEVQVF